MLSPSTQTSFRSPAAPGGTREIRCDHLVRIRLSGADRRLLRAPADPDDDHTASGARERLARDALAVTDDRSFVHTLRNGLDVTVDYVRDTDGGVTVRTITPLGMPQCLAVVDDAEADEISVAAHEREFGPLDDAA